MKDAGIVIHPLQAARLDNGKIRLSGSFGVFTAGHLVAHFYDDHGSSLGTMVVANVTPAEPVLLETEVAPSGKPARVSLHLEDDPGWTGVRFRKYKWVAAKIADMKWPARALILLLLAAIFTEVPAAAQRQTQSPITAVPEVSAQDLLAQPVGANWTSYNGDYSGRRYSSSA